MATHSSVLAWRIPGTGEPGGLPSMGSHRVGHDWSGLAAAGKEKDNLSTLWSPLLHISRSDVFMHMAALGNCQDVCPSSASVNRNPIVSILPLMMTSKGEKKGGDSFKANRICSHRMKAIAMFHFLRVGMVLFWGQEDPKLMCVMSIQSSSIDAMQIPIYSLGSSTFE